MCRCWWATAAVSTRPCCCTGCGAAHSFPARHCVRCMCTMACNRPPMTGCCIASSNAQHWASNWPCIACRSTTAQASALRAQRGRPGVQRSRPSCATAKRWHWHSTRTTRPRLSCCVRWGSGVDGLAAMSAHSHLGQHPLWRPLLAVPRSALLDYARQHALPWIEDPSNGDDHADRNFLRLQVLPLLRQRWPHAAAALAGSAAHCGQTRQLLDEEDAELIAHLEVAPRVLSLPLLRQVSPGAPRGCCVPGWSATAPPHCRRRCCSRTGRTAAGRQRSPGPAAGAIMPSGNGATMPICCPRSCRRCPPVAGRLGWACPWRCLTAANCACRAPPASNGHCRSGHAWAVSASCCPVARIRMR